MALYITYRCKHCPDGSELSTITQVEESESGQTFWVHDADIDHIEGGKLVFLYEVSSFDHEAEPR